MATKKESGFDRLARLIKEEGEDIRNELGGKIGSLEGKVGSLEGKVGSLERKVGSLEKKVDEGFARIERRLDQTIQPQLDDHARRIKVLEPTVTSH